MKTLIELYDDLAIENVLAPEVFHPDQVVYLCPPQVSKNGRIRKTLRDFYAHRELSVHVRIEEVSLYDTDQIMKVLLRLYQEEPDCAIDIAGGTDAALFACGMFCRDTGIPCFTWSRKQSSFYDIHQAPWANRSQQMPVYTVDDFFRMVGGRLRQGRVDNHILEHYKALYRPFFEVFLKYRRDWPEEVIFMQRISGGDPHELHVCGNTVQKGEHGSRVHANEPLLNDLQKIGMIHNLAFTAQDRIVFDFHDEQVRAWLRDAGSVLELYLYQTCLDTGIFTDVISSAVVDWDDEEGATRVTNEIDVAATRGTIPLFVSCKTCEIRTEALNELAILRDRFGGKGNKAVIVTTEKCNAAARHRAAQLNIAVIDLEELESDRTA